MIKRFSAILVIAALALCFASCNGKKQGGSAPSASSSAGYYEFLGEYAYDLPVTCMVYEPVEGETDENGRPFYGVQYREIKDLDKLLASSDVKFLLYFHSSANSDVAGITAAVEEIAEGLAGKILVISLDAAEVNDLVAKYEITMLPEFVLCGNGIQSQVFGASAREKWTMQEVVDWLASNGYSLKGG